MTTAAAPRWTVNLSILFTELPLLDRPAAAAAAGFTAAELWWPFDDDPSPADSDVAALRHAFADAGIRLSGLNLLDDLGRGERGTLSDPAQTDRFRANLPVAVGLAEDLGCTALNALYGNRVPGLDPADQDELALENLALAARAAHDIDAVLLVEALNAHESPRYPLVSAKAAVAVVDRVNEVTGLGNVRFLCDVYHLSRMGEDPLAVVDAHADRIGHVQVADVPGRNQPGTGSLDLPALLDRLAAHGYPGLIGLEYRPTGPSAASLDWLPRGDRADRREALR
ncbi:TIM barrel protein [Streptomyces sp. NPDC127098]|uniref:TIM barrel protein n=1 Tax=Streptomyces sp. NPDC127098 TaxID=3347137 RepID=UPI003655CCF3